MKKFKITQTFTVTDKFFDETGLRLKEHVESGQLIKDLKSNEEGIDDIEMVFEEITE